MNIRFQQGRRTLGKDLAIGGEEGRPPAVRAHNGAGRCQYVARHYFTSNGRLVLTPLAERTIWLDPTFNVMSLSVRGGQFFFAPPAAGPYRSGAVAGLELYPDAVTDLRQDDQAVSFTGKRNGGQSPGRILAAIDLGDLGRDASQILRVVDIAHESTILPEVSATDVFRYFDE
jgi:hypothetical protein